jgi:hypothetical protein
MNEADYFWRLVNTPAYWQDAARDLVCAANRLKADYRKRDVFGVIRDGYSARDQLRERHMTPRASIVLYAIAIENMLKAIIVGRGEDPIGPDGRLRRWFATHDLNKLTKRSGITGVEERVLAQLSDFIRAGKYPAGLEDGEGERAHSYFPDSVFAAIEQVLPLLEDTLASMPCARDRLPRTDLVTLGVDETESGGSS